MMLQSIACPLPCVPALASGGRSRVCQGQSLGISALLGLLTPQYPWQITSCGAHLYKHITNTNSITTCWPQSNWKSCGGLEILLRYITCQQKVDSSGQFKELSKQVVDTKHILPKMRD